VLADTSITADVGLFFAAVAAGASVVAVKQSKSAGKAARDTVQLAADTLRETELARRDAERDHLRRRLERAGELLEAILHSSADEGHSNAWTRPRNELSAAIVGLRDILPICTRICDEAVTRSTAQPLVGDARNEIEARLRGLESG